MEVYRGNISIFSARFFPVSGLIKVVYHKKSNLRKDSNFENKIFVQGHIFFH